MIKNVCEDLRINEWMCFCEDGITGFQMPANMKTVEKQFEDVAHDMECHMDTEGNIYDFAFGLNWSGIICDERTKKYRKLK